MIRVLAVDDEVPALEEMVYLLRRDPRVDCVAMAGDATNAMRLVGDTESTGHRFDVLFLDIRMPGPSGVDLARFINNLPSPPAVVFVTAHEDFAVAAFELHAVDYLLKPLEEARLTRTLDRIATTLIPVNDQPRVAVELAGRIRFIPRQEIWYAEARGDYVRLRTSEGGFLIRSTLSTLEREWTGAGFVRVHRSLLVATRHISELRIDGTRASVRVGEEVLQVSRRQTREVRERLLYRSEEG